MKTAVVQRLREMYRTCVWAFGNSPLDLGMLRETDHAVVVVGEERTRNKSMEASLQKAITNDGLRARQALLPSHVFPRLNTAQLPLIDLTSPPFVDAILGRTPRPARLRVAHASHRPAAQLLATPMRDAALAGPALREAHRRAG